MQSHWMLFSASTYPSILAFGKALHLLFMVGKANCVSVPFTAEGDLVIRNSGFDWTIFYNLMTWFWNTDALLASGYKGINWFANHWNSLLLEIDKDASRPRLHVRTPVLSCLFSRTHHQNRHSAMKMTRLIGH